MQSTKYERGLVGPWEGGQIINGDSKELIKEIPPDSVSLFFCDPPYGQGNRDGEDFISRAKELMGKGKMSQADVREIMNDHNEAHQLFKDMLPLYLEKLRPGGVICICGAGGGGENPVFANWAKWIDDHKGFTYKQMVVWDKCVPGFGWHFRRTYEVVHVAWKNKRKCQWFPGHLKNVGMNRFPNILHVKYRNPEPDKHPTPKPPELIEPFIEIFTKPRGLVVDCFCGSGSTGVAAVRRNRKFLGFELDPQWIDYANDRIKAEILCIDRKSMESGQMGLFS